MKNRFIIAGVDRTKDILFTQNQRVTIEQQLGHEDDCRFVIKSGDRPLEGEEILIYMDQIKLFAGIIDEVHDMELGQGIHIHYSCRARDYTYQLNQRLVVESYTDMAADVIVRDILTKYCPGFSDEYVQAAAPVVEWIMFDYKLPSECFRELCDYVGWEWFVDYDKVVHFYNPQESAESAPMAISLRGPYRNFRHSIDIVGLRNRVYVRGGKMLSDEAEFRYVADGKQRLWVLGHQPHSPWVQVGDASQPKLKPGLEYVDEEANYAYMYNQAEKYIRCSYHTSTPQAGTTMIFSYKYPMDVITMVEDMHSQQRIAAVQGGDGVYEHQIIDDTLLTIEAAEAAGEADLRTHCNPRVKGSFETEYIVPEELEAVLIGKTPAHIWQPGQLLPINLPNRGITGNFLIQRVSLTPLTPGLWTYRIEYGGRLLGIADFLKALVSAQQKKQMAETAILSKFDRQTETAGVSDTAETTPRNLPYRCGDPDAICGFVMLDSGGDWVFFGGMPVARGDWT